MQPITQSKCLISWNEWCISLEHNYYTIQIAAALTNRFKAEKATSSAVISNVFLSLIAWSLTPHAESLIILISYFWILIHQGLWKFPHLVTIWHNHVGQKCLASHTDSHFYVCYSTNAWDWNTVYLSLPLSQTTQRVGLTLIARIRVVAIAHYPSFISRKNILDVVGDIWQNLICLYS